MIAVQVMANDVAVGFGGAGGYLEMNVYKPLIIFNVTHSIALLSDGVHELPQIPRGRDQTQSEKDPTIRGRIAHAGHRALACHRLRQSFQIAHFAMDNDLTLKQSALKLGFVTEDEFNRVVDPKKMVRPYVATAAA